MNNTIPQPLYIGLANTADAFGVDLINTRSHSIVASRLYLIPEQCIFSNIATNIDDLFP